MQKIAIIIIFFTSAIFQAQKQSVVSEKIIPFSYYLKDDILYKCFDKIKNSEKCEIKTEIKPGTDEYKDWIDYFSDSIGYVKNYAYDLPFEMGKKFKVIQGYNGNFSHTNLNAIDFRMPKGSKVLAARSGIVVKVIDSNRIGCPSRRCLEFGNYISILHSDKSRAEYWHIMHKGVTVKVGDKIIKGDLIAYSGSTGWSSEEHLHFVCYPPPFKKMTRLEAAKNYFRTGDGKRVEFLYEGKSYKKNY